MTERLTELLELAAAGDDDVLLQVQSEIALMPESREALMERAVAHAEEYAEQFAPAQEAVSAATLDKMADDAGF